MGMPAVDEGIDHDEAQRQQHRRGEPVHRHRGDPVPDGRAALVEEDEGGVEAEEDHPGDRDETDDPG